MNFVKTLSSLSGGSTLTYMLLGIILSLFLTLFGVGWLYKGALEEIANLDATLQIAQGNTAILQESLQKQNEAIVALRAQKTQKDTSAVDRIIIKDSSCVAELEGYKELFKELGK
ncbi:hypothetical protein [Helicobacter rodentium]|uniref:hypothetical protein n=2 Tax=Helicobacter rodentium TaxID=59617 RepID=UPI0023F461A2|nr:hypothetical protein [Helicobacter rodentium]